MNQFEVARRLATRYGHSWGQISQEELAGLLDSCTDQVEACEAIHSWTLRNVEPGPCGMGITAPTVDECGDLVHSTGSGRLQWNITRAGACGFIVARPEGACLQAVFVEGDPVDLGVFGDQQACSRHLQALEYAISAVAPSNWQDTARCWYWFGEAEPYASFKAYVGRNSASSVSRMIGCLTDRLVEAGVMSGYDQYSDDRYVKLGQALERMLGRPGEDAKADDPTE